MMLAFKDTGPAGPRLGPGGGGGAPGPPIPGGGGGGDPPGIGGGPLPFPGPIIPGGGGAPDAIPGGGGAPEAPPPDWMIWSFRFISSICCCKALVCWLIIVGSLSPMIELKTSMVSMIRSILSSVLPFRAEPRKSINSFTYFTGYALFYTNAGHIKEYSHFPSRNHQPIRVKCL